MRMLGHLSGEVVGRRIVRNVDIAIPFDQRIIGDLVSVAIAVYADALQIRLWKKMVAL